ncbi:MAG: S1/P1 nuclease [Bacteroidales bacterium]|jgi:hypothetical protein|nr:S1/P1 nuclease [Bacteroidales bacterium]
MIKKFFFPLLFLAPFIVFGWGKTGHRTIAQMGQNLLSEDVQDKITATLSGSNLAMVANWADEIRSDKKYNYVSNWHYTNLDKNLTREEYDKIALKQNNGQVLFRVYSIAQTLHNRQKGELQSVQSGLPENTGNKKDDVCQENDTVLLKLLVHFVGDMHQPLHLGRYEDLGANKIYVKWFGQKTNLHSVWDNKIISIETLSYTEWVQYLSSTRNLKPVKITSEEELRKAVMDWGWEVYQLTNIIYKNVSDTDNTFTYIYNYKWIYEQCFSNAAERLAGIMNYIYG